MMERAAVFPRRRAPTAADLRRVVDCALRVPTKYREFRQDTAQAQRIHGLGPDVLTALLDLGLPHRLSGGRLLLDPQDLSNASFQLRLPSARAMAMRGWAIALRDVHAGAIGERTVTIAPMCPDPGHDGKCDFEIDFGGPRRPIGPLAEFDPAPNMVRHRMAGSSRFVPTGLHQLMLDLSRFELYLLPDELSVDFGFARETGLADCPLATALLTHEARTAGFVVRSSFGLLLARPYAILHMWAEVLDGDEWLAVDPLIISTLTGRGLLDETDWPPYRSLGGAVWRLDQDFRPLLLHNGDHCEYSLKTDM